MWTDIDRLKLILEVISRIEQYTSRGEEAFRQDELIQVWVAYHLEAIWEIAEHLSSSDFKDGIQLDLYEQVVVSHNILWLGIPFCLDSDFVWNIVELDLPDLKKRIQKILQEIE